MKNQRECSIIVNCCMCLYVLQLYYKQMSTNKIINVPRVGLMHVQEV